MSDDRAVSMPPDDGRVITREDGWLILDPLDETRIPALAAAMIARHLPVPLIGVPTDADSPDEVRSVLARMQARQNMHDRQRALFGDFDDD